MLTLGLTGSIGMGKSATASMFRDEGIPVYDADAAVHAIYEPGGLAVEPLSKVFPDVIVEDRVDRTRLRERVLNDPGAMKQLESIVHPLVGQTQIDFRKTAKSDGADMIVLDIPLLFETGGDARVDYTIVVSATAEEQRKRVLGRDGMTEDAFEKILAKQLPDAEKRARADFVINSRIDLEYAREQVKALISALRRTL
ncbi:dephospho-CoA kinase [Ponticaulis profundi]|uniref:Dephospho-CoA kinase n=1 Tax=Ponticaulis profundi TaxID=2665222 RepID=A0ABW1S9D4_9PROT